VLKPTTISYLGQVPARCRSATSFGPVCDQDSEMEFGLNRSRWVFTLNVVRRVALRHPVWTDVTLHIEITGV